MTDTELDPITEVTAEFGEIYRAVKGTKGTDGWEKLLKDAQKAFFEAATEKLKSETLARKTVTLPEGAKADEYVRKYHPGFRLVDQKKNRVILEEDPATKDFVYINPIDQMVYRRSRTQPGPSLDIDLIIKKEPKLFMEISEWPSEAVDLVTAAMEFASPGDRVTQDSVDTCLMVNLGPEKRQVKDPATWTKEQATAVKPYLMPGAVGVRLTPPRPAKPSELQSGEIDE
jgi:hypothetical protein